MNKKLKQGQTIYILDSGVSYNPPRPSIIKVFLHSRKQELPPEGCYIEKYPVNYIVDLVNKHGSKNIFFSRRRAKTALKRFRARFYSWVKCE